MDVDAAVAARVLALEAEHKVKLSLLQTALEEEVDLLRGENRRLREELQSEARLNEDLEKVRGASAGRPHCRLRGAPAGWAGHQPHTWTARGGLGPRVAPSRRASRSVAAVASSTGPHGQGVQPGVLRGHRWAFEPGSLARPPSGLVPQSSVVSRTPRSSCWRLAGFPSCSQVRL